AVAAVEAPEHAVDLDPDEDDAMVVRIDHHARDERRADRTLLRDIDRQAFPLHSAVPRAIDAGRSGSREEYVWVDGIDGERPHGRQIALLADALPVRAAIGAPKNAGV